MSKKKGGLMNKKAFKDMCSKLGMLTDNGKIDYEWVALLMWLQRNGERCRALQSNNSYLAKVYENDINIINAYIGKE